MEFDETNKISQLRAKLDKAIREVVKNVNALEKYKKTKTLGFMAWNSEKEGLINMVYKAIESIKYI